MAQRGRPKRICGYFGEWLNTKLNEHGETYGELATKLGISRSTLQLFSKHKISPQPIYLYALAYLFNEDVDCLFELVRKDWPKSDENRKRGSIHADRSYNY